MSEPNLATDSHTMNDPYPGADVTASRPSVAYLIGLKFLRLPEELGVSLRVRRPAERLVERAVALLQLRKARRLGSAYSRARVIVTNSGTITIHRGVFFDGAVLPIRLAAGPLAEIEIGADTDFNYGAVIDSRCSVRVGRRNRIASRARLIDHDAYRIAPIVLEDDVWLANGVTIRPGVTVGRGSVIGAGAVVTHDVPPLSLAIGDPARSIPLSSVQRARQTPYVSRQA